MSENINQLEQLIEYEFNDKELLVEALSHPSLKQHTTKLPFPKDYERLELLGDSVLNFIITEILFKNFTEYDEGKLAKIRSSLVCKDTLCKIAAKINLEQYIIMTHGEEISGGRSNPNNIENTLEALIAAIYLDSNIEQIKLIVINLWSELLFTTNLTDIDPKTTLQELVQARGNSKPKYKVLKQDGSPHSPIFTIAVTALGKQETATGNTIKAAEKVAARKLLELFNHKA